LRFHFPTKSLAKKILRRWAPDLLVAVKAVQAAQMRPWFKDRRFSQHRRRVGFSDDRSSTFSQAHSLLAVFERDRLGSIEPKRLGTYEGELHSIVEEFLRSGYDMRLGKKLPSAAIHSYNIDPWAQAQQRDLRG
jgi:hypothetical protein